MNQEKYLESIDQSLKVIASELIKMNKSQPHPTKDAKMYKDIPPDRKAVTK